MTARDNIHFLIIETIASAYNNLSRTISSSAGLSFTQYRILLSIYENETIGIKDISRCLELRHNTTSVAVSGLEKKQLVKRVQQQQDGRLVFLRFTAKGARVLKGVDPLLAENNNSALQPEALELLSVYVLPNQDICKMKSASEEFSYVSMHFSVLSTLHKMISDLLAATEGLSLTGYLLLLRAADTNRTFFLHELAADLHLKSSTISQSVTSLADQELIARVQDDADMRFASLRITKEGLGCLGRIENTFKEIWGDSFGPIVWLQLGDSIREYLNKLPSKRRLK